MKKLLTILSVVGLIMVGSGPASAGELWGTGSPDWAYGTSGQSPVIFQFDTCSGVISKTLSFGAGNGNWMWISGLADNGQYLYASHNIYDTTESSNTHDFRIAKINRTTGAVISDTSISGFLGQTYSQVNALDFKDGKLYAVENATSGSTIRGYAMEILLAANGDVSGATKGAFVGPYPDCGLDYHDGLWYATSWGYTPLGYEGSIVYTSPDIMNTNFTQVGTGDSAVEGIGMIDGWEFDDAGTLFAVTWYNVPASATAVYSINTSTWTATLLYDLASQLPPSIISLDGLSEVIQTPTAITLASFEAEAGNRIVKLTWVTETEIDNAGFNILRAESEDGEYVKINDSLISAEGSPTQGATYQFVDESVKNRATYYYQLEDVDLNGTSTMHGPVSATPRLVKGANR